LVYKFVGPSSWVTGEKLADYSVPLALTDQLHYLSILLGLPFTGQADWMIDPLSPEIRMPLFKGLSTTRKFKTSSSSSTSESSNLDGRTLND
jgi:hypothetical protein